MKFSAPPVTGTRHPIYQSCNISDASPLALHYRLQGHLIRTIIFWKAPPKTVKFNCSVLEGLSKRLKLEIQET